MKAGLRRLDQVCAIVMGQAPLGETYNTNRQGLPLIAGAGDFANGVPRAKKFTTETSKRCQPGDIILGIRASIGERVVADTEYCLGRGVAGLSPLPGLSDRYLWNWLGYAKDTLSSKGRGATFKQVNREDVAGLEIPLPPIEEQQRIAEILDRAHDLRVKRRQVLAYLDDLTQSIFVDMFASALPGWQTLTVDELVDIREGGIRTGPFGSQLLHSEFVNEGIAVLGIDNAVHNTFAWSQRRFITPEKYAHLKRYTVHPGDVLITIMGTCGRAAIVPNDVPLAINTKHLCCITLDHGLCNPEYLHAYFLMHPLARSYLSRTAKGAIMAGLNMGIIKAMPVLLPPVDLQEVFALRLRAVQKVRERCILSLERLDTLFEAMQQQAFAGRLEQGFSRSETEAARHE